VRNPYLKQQKYWENIYDQIFYGQSAIPKYVEDLLGEFTPKICPHCGAKKE